MTHSCNLVLCVLLVLPAVALAEVDACQAGDVCQAGAEQWWHDDSGVSLVQKQATLLKKQATKTRAAPIHKTAGTQEDGASSQKSKKTTAGASRLKKKNADASRLKKKNADASRLKKKNKHGALIQKKTRDMKKTQKKTRRVKKNADAGGQKKSRHGSTAKKKGGAPCSSVGVSSFDDCDSKCDGDYSAGSSGDAITCECGDGWSCGGSGGDEDDSGGDEDDSWGDEDDSGGDEDDSGGAPSPPAEPPAAGSAAERWVAAHNKYRCMHDVPLLTWNPTIAAACLSYAESTGGAFEHSTDNDLGENLAWASPDPQSPEESVADWYSEIKDTRGGEVSSTEEMESTDSGHYTQLVWKATTEVGCATYAQLTICRYKPAGNFEGEFEENVNAPVKSEEECEQ